METKEFSHCIVQKYPDEAIEELTKQMRKGVEVKNRKYDFKWHYNCFVGKDLVQWMISNGHVHNVEAALELGNYLMEKNVFHHILHDGEFKNQRHFYRFNADEKDKEYNIKDKTWHNLLKDLDGKIISSGEVKDIIGENTDWHKKSPGEHHIHEILIDAYNGDTLDNCRPITWVDPSNTTAYDMIAIGGGAGGLITAIGTSLAGGKAAIIERNMMGGDCLNTGCVPSKALIKCAKVAHTCKNAEKYGVGVEGEVKIDFAKVMKRVREVRAHISEADSAQKFVDKYGIDVYLGHAQFTSPNEIQINDKTLTFTKAGVATGGSAYIPDIEGLKDFPYFVSENIFNLTEQPKKLLIIGAGPIGGELGQSFQRLGTEVIMISKDEHFLPREDPDAAAFLHQQMLDDGVEIIFEAQLIKLNVIKHPGKIWTPEAEVELEIEQDGQTRVLYGDAILVAAGRRPNVHGIGLEEAGVEYNDTIGIKINDNCRTTNENVYAVGDVGSRYQFTHNSDKMAKIVAKNALFSENEKYSEVNMSWGTYTEPEIAHVGKYPKELEAEDVKYDTYLSNFNRNDRSICEGTDGMVKIHCKQGSDKILGCTGVGGPAGDMIGSVATAMLNNIGLSTFGTAIHPYPTYGEAFKALSGQYNVKYHTQKLTQSS